MHGRLAVSDSLHEQLAIVTLPDLEVSTTQRMPFRPGRLLSGAYLYCADTAESAVHALRPDTLDVEKSFIAGPEIEALALSASGKRLFALCGGSDSLQMLDAGKGTLLSVRQVGMHPRALTQHANGNYLAVACGGTCDVALLDPASMRLLANYPAGGITCDVCFFAGQLMALCAYGEFEMGTVVGAITADGKWSPWTALPGLPGVMTPCGGGLLVGHLRGLTMLEPPNGRIRWQTKITGLPTQIIPVGRAACFADSLDGMVGLIDLRRGTILRRLRVEEPGGLAVL